MVANNDTMRMSLVVATVGRSAELRRLFQSLIEQSNRCFEVVVVDQNTDNRLESLIDYARNTGLAINHLRQAEKNLSMARNMGIQAAQYGVIAFPDDDCWYEPSVIETVLGTFAMHPYLGGVVGHWVERGGGNTGPRELSWHRMRRFREVDANSIELFFKREGFTEVGGFDEMLGVARWFGAGEETDLVMRIVRSGVRVLYVPAVRVHHPWHQASVGSVRDRWTRTRARARGTGALYAKHGLAFHVVARGIVSPLARCLLPPYAMNGVASHLATTVGRWEGYWRWRREYGSGISSSVQVARTHPAGHSRERIR